MMFLRRTYKPWLPVAKSWRRGFHRTASLANASFMRDSFDSAAGSWKDSEFLERARSSASWAMDRTESVSWGS